MEARSAIEFCQWTRGAVWETFRKGKKVSKETTDFTEALLVSG
jgi:hypothetical protein